MAKRRLLLHPPRTSGPLDDTVLVLWHGAGGDVDHPTLVRTAVRAAEKGAFVARARFPYRIEGRKAPDRMPKLIASARRTVDDVVERSGVSEPRLILGGRSMGGRVTSHLAAEGARIDALVFFAYPLHPPGQPTKLRDAHLSAVRCPMLFLQGDRDKLAELGLLKSVLTRLRDRATLEVLAGADHGMKRVDPDGLADLAISWMGSATSRPVRMRDEVRGSSG